MKQADERTFYWAAAAQAGSFWTISAVQGVKQVRWRGSGGGAASRRNTQARAGPTAWPCWDKPPVNMKLEDDLFALVTLFDHELGRRAIRSRAAFASWVRRAVPAPFARASSKALACGVPMSSRTAIPRSDRSVSASRTGRRSF
jgi:hypothetical protein